MDQMAKGIAGLDQSNELHVFEFEEIIWEKEVKRHEKSIQIKNIYFPDRFWQRIGLCRQTDLDELRKQYN
jgi:hypothetical protein